MAKSLAVQTHTLSRKDLLDIMKESGIFSGRKEARAALGAVCSAIRAWMLAMTKKPDKATMRMLRLPGVGTIRIRWHGYGKRYAPKVVVSIGPARKVREQMRAANKEEWERWRQAHE